MHHFELRFYRSVIIPGFYSAKEMLQLDIVVTQNWHSITLIFKIFARQCHSFIIAETLESMDLSSMVREKWSGHPNPEKTNIGILSKPDIPLFLKPLTIWGPILRFVGLLTRVLVDNLHEEIISFLLYHYKERSN